MSAPADELMLTLAWFSTAMPDGPAYGDPERNTWSNFCGVLWFRRHGEKDGPGVCLARFKLEADGRRVRRLKTNVLARTAIALDIEWNKTTGELPPTLDEIAKRIEARGWAAALYTSHSHCPPNDIRCRVVLPMSQEINHELPAVEIVAAALGVDGVLDMSKLGAASYFYLPSCSGDDAADLHQELIVTGSAIDAAWLVERATALQEARKAEAERQAAEAHKAAQARREARLAAGFDPSASLIEKIRAKLPSLAQILIDHRYDTTGTGAKMKFRHPNSSSGGYGADIKEIGGVERVYSHNGTDPLRNEAHALDAFEVVTILDYGGDANKALRGEADRLGLSKREEMQAVAALIHQLRKLRQPNEVIEAAVLAKGKLLGMLPAEVYQVARHVVSQLSVQEAA